jgi:hypothetical protein
LSGRNRRNQSPLASNDELSMQLIRLTRAVEGLMNEIHQNNRFLNDYLRMQANPRWMYEQERLRNEPRVFRNEFMSEWTSEGIPTPRQAAREESGWDGDSNRNTA